MNAKKITLFLESINFFIERFTQGDTIKNCVEVAKENYNEKYKEHKLNKIINQKEYIFTEFARFTSIKLQYDHSKESMEKHIDEFINKYVEKNIYSDEDKFSFHFMYYHHYNDTWKEHGITQRFIRKHNYHLMDINLLHFAAIIGDVKLIEVLIEKGFGINKIDSSGKKAVDYLNFNENYTNLEDYKKIKNKLTQKSHLKLVKK